MINPDDLQKIMAIVTAAGVFFTTMFLLRIGVELWPAISEALGQ